VLRVLTVTFSLPLYRQTGYGPYCRRPTARQQQPHNTSHIRLLKMRQGCLMRIMDVTRRDHIEKRGHQNQPWHYRGCRKNPGKKTTIFRSCGENVPTPSAKHCVIW